MRVRRILAAGMVLALATSLVAPALAGAVTTPPADTPAAAPAPAPVLLVRSYATTPGDVVLGERFTLSLTIRNATKQRAKDVVVALGATAAGAGGDGAGGGSGAELVSLDSSDMRFLGDIKGGGVVSVTFNLITSPGAAAGVLSLPVNISSDVNGQRESSSQKIGLKLNRTATFEEQAPDFPKTAIQGEPIALSIDVRNTSAFAVPGVALRLEGDGFEIDGTAQVGKIEPNDAGTLEAKVTPIVAGDATLTVVATYRDDFGQQREVRFAHKLKVEKAGPVEEGGPTGKPEEEKPKSFIESVASFFMGLLGLGG